jgi:Zn-dependent membrane protease YugP
MGTMEWIYVISTLLILPVVIWALIVSIRVYAVMGKYKKVEINAGLTARDLVKKIADENGLDISVETASGFVGDHYDPRRKVVALSHDIINSSSVTALAVAAHECGHALQHKEKYAPLRLRGFIIAISNFASKLLLPLIVIGLILQIFVFYNSTMVMAYVLVGMCAFYGLSALAELITLPAEFDASRRAKKMLDTMNITDDMNERKGVRRVLSAAAQTYIAAFAVSLVYFLRLFSYLYLIFGRRS